MNKLYRPAGNPIVLKKSEFDSDLFSSKNCRLFQSGTASLAAAIAACIKLSKVPTKPQVIIPAYACPDLVSASLFAGAKPILVDLEENSPRMSIEHVLNSITSDTVAILAVNFMGLPEDLPRLRDTCEKNGLYLIYDCAQWFPMNGDYHWPGDFNIISFGRGKPVNLLHGGAVLFDNAAIDKALKDLPTPKPNSLNDLTQYVKIKLYNLAMQPRIYRYVIQLPGLNIGQTQYKPMQGLAAMSPFYRDLINANVEEFRSRPNILQYIEKKISCVSNPLLVDLVAQELDGNPLYLLRYPILITDNETRNRIYENTRAYGSSILYRTPLNQISGLHNILDRDIAYPNAIDFANHLITLPCHEDIDCNVIDHIFDGLHSALKDSEE